MVTQRFVRKVIADITKWMIAHNLGRKETLGGGFITNVEGAPGLVMVLRYNHGDLRFLFDQAYGGGSLHLLNDFDDEVLKPLRIHAERVGAYTIGLFQGRMLPRKNPRSTRSR